jgi:hypothetical protein
LQVQFSYCRSVRDVKVGTDIPYRSDPAESSLFAYAVSARYWQIRFSNDGHNLEGL